MSRLNVVTDLIRRFDCKSYCEVGVKQGRMLVHVVGSTNVRGIGVDVFCNVPNDGESYDSWDFDEIKEEYYRNVQPYGSQIRTIADFSVNAAQLVDWVDLVFIDAAHDYENVIADINAWRPKCKIISGHDYDPEKFPGVCKAVDELVPERELAANACWWALA